MGVTIHELRAVISGNLVGFSQMIDGAVSKTNSLRKAWGDFASDASRATNRIVGSFALIGGAVTTAATTMGFEFLTIQENAQAAFESMYKGDAVKAKQFLDELTQFAAKTPFELKGLLLSTQQLTGAGLAAEKVIPMLTGVGDAVIHAGRGTEEIKRASVALQQILTAEKFTADNMRQLSEAGVPVWQFMADGIGTTTGELRKMVEQGLIPAQAGIDAMLKGISMSDAAGAMEKGANRIQGLFSNLIDMADRVAGEMMRPIFDVTKEMMSSVLAPENMKAIEGAGERIKGKLASVAEQLRSTFGGNIKDIIRNVGMAAEWSAEAFAGFVKWVKDSGPTFLIVANTIGQFLKPILQFVKDHPQIIGAFIALKMTGFLGINDAVKSLGSALLQTFMSMGKMTGASTSLGSALKGMGIALAVTGIILLAKKIYEASQAIQDYNKAVKESQRLDSKMDQKVDRKRELKLRDLSEIENPQLRAEKVQEELARARTEAQGYDSSAMGQAANAQKFRDELGTDVAGNKVLEAMDAEADRAAAQARSAQAYVYQLEDQLHGTAKEADTLAKTPEFGTDSPVGTTPNSSSGLSDLQSKVSPEAQAMQERADAADNAMKTFSGSLMEWEGVISGEILNGFESSFADLAKTFRDGEISEQEFQMGIQGMNEGLSSVVPFFQKLDGLSESLPETTLQGFEDQFMTLQSQLQSGELNANQYAMELDNLNASIDRAGQGVQNAARFEEQLASFRERLGEAGVTASSAQMAGYQSRFDALNQKFTSGAISAAKFAQSTDALQKEMDAAGQAAIKELQAKERARLLSGNFTQEEFQKAAEDRIIQMRMQQFDQYVEQSVNLMMGFNNGLNQVNTGLNNFGNNVQQFGNGFGAMQQQFDPEQLRAAQTIYSQFASSVQGQMSRIINEIGLAQSRLSLSSIVYGDAIKGQERWDTITWIEELSRQLERLQYAPAPQFVAGLGDFRFVDPGLQTGRGGETGGGQYHFSFPNVDAVSARTAGLLVDSMEQEMKRRGRRIF